MKTFRNVLVFIVLLLTLSFSCLPAFAAGQVNLNTATLEQLVELKGIGEKTVLKIIEYRNEHAFASVDELVNIKGIGTKTLESLRDQLTVEDPQKKS